MPVETHLFADATHSFDDDAASDPRTRYRPDLEARVAGLLAGVALGPARGSRVKPENDDLI